MILTVFTTLVSLLWLPLLILFLLTRHKKTNDTTAQSDQINVQRDQLWQDYLASFRGVVQAGAEKHLLDTLLAGKTALDYMHGPLPSQSAVAEPSLPNRVLATPAQPAVAMAQTASIKLTQPIDNTILLLYFGAFLLVASVGLFVAIGGLGGLMRTVIVGFTAAVLYAGGLWLYLTNQKLAQAGISFVGTGMIVAPLTGVAWYNLVSGQTNGGQVWLLTSMACIALYVHAYSKVKQGFIAYLLIGSFVSSIESAVLTVNVPAYGYSWGLIVAALLLAFSSRRRGQAPELAAASDASAQLLIPLSVIGSIALFPKFGSVQLAITLFLSGVYYTLLAASRSAYRTTYFIAAQTSYIAAVVSVVYATQKTLLATGISLSIIAALYAVVIMRVSRETLKKYSLIEITTSVSLIALPLSFTRPWAFVAALVVATVLASIVWLKMRREPALEVAGLLVAGLPFVIGQYALADRLGSWTQVWMTAMSAGLLYGLVVASSRWTTWKQYYSTSAGLYILGAALLLVPAALLSFSTLGVVTFVLMLSFVGLRYLADDFNWLLCSSVVVLVPLVYTVFGYGIDSVRFSVAVAVALLWNAAVSLATREAVVRWIVVGCLLITPLAIGGGGLGIHWGAAGYASGYLLVMACCIAARAIARGKLLLSVKVPIVSYYTAASQAYVTGYVVAGLLSIGISLADAHSQLVTSLILGTIALAVILVAKIERSNQLLALLPVILQALLFSAIRPDIDKSTVIGVTAIVSTLAAVVAYTITQRISPRNDEATQQTRIVSLMTAYIGPALVFSQAHPSMLLPVSLFIAGLLTYSHYASAQQSYKELSLGVSIAAVLWLLYLAGYTNLHIHTHLIAVCLAGFAYWRSVLGDTKSSQGYVQALFLVVTVPLALQSLAGESGGTYGLMLIAEQVGFMVIGASFGQRFLLRWGLWTALAAVLFQLKGLGWAFLTMLALIIIGVAVYRLQKHPPDSQK